MTIDKNTINYFKKIQSGKGSAGQLLDSLFFDIVLFIILLLMIFQSSKLLILSLIITSVLTLAADYIIRYFKSKQLEKFVLKEITNLRHELLIEKLIFLSHKDRRSVVVYGAENTLGKKYEATKDPLIYLESNEKVLIDMILALPPKKAGMENLLPSIEYMTSKKIKRAILGCSTSFDDSANAFIEKSGMEISIIKQDVLLESAMEMGIQVTDDEIKEALDMKMKSGNLNKKSFLTAAANPKNIKMFSIYGLMLFILAAFTPFKMYYYIASTVCFLISIIIFIYNNQIGKEKNSAEI